MASTVLVIIPTYNEAENISVIVSQIFKVSNSLKNYDLEVLVVDDNSPDKTGELVRAMQKQNPRLHLLSGPRRGLGKAYVRGFNHGLKLGNFTVFIAMDADYSHDPMSIPTLMRAIENGSDYVIGSRYVKGGGVAGNWPLVRRIQSRIANFLVRILVGVKPVVSDLTSGYKAIRRSALEEISLDNIMASGYAFQVNLLHEFSKAGFKIKEVPIIFRQRRHGKSKMRIRDITEFIYLTYRLNPDSRARQFLRFGLVGAMGTVVNLGLLVVLVQFLKVEALAAIVVAIEASIISNFFMNHHYTFRLATKERLSKLISKLARYNLITLGGALITYAAFAVFYKALGIHYVLADLIAIAIAMSWNFWLSVRVVWKVVDK